MGLVDRISAARSEKRTIGGTPWMPFVPFGQGGPVHPNKWHIGQDRAVALAPVYGAIKLLADGVASLPLKIYRNVDGKKIPWTGPSLFDKPSPTCTYYDWMFQGMSSLLLHGNALGYIPTRDGFGFPTSIIWLPPERCHIEDDETADFANPVRPRYYFSGRLIDPADLLHVKAFTVAGRTAGISPLQAFRLLIEGGHDQQAYSKEWFSNGGFPPGTFKNTELEVDADQSRAIRANLTETLRRRQPLVFGRDWEYNPISVPPDQAQFVETTRLTATQIATIYGVPPDRIGGSRGDSLTYSTQEQGTNDLITWSLRSWLVRWEAAFFDVLPQQRYAKFDADDLVRTDQATRYANNKIARDTGWLLNSEIRDAEELPPLPGAIAAEQLPGEVLVAIARGVGQVPKSFEALLAPPETPPAPPVAASGGFSGQDGTPADPGKPDLALTPPGADAPPLENAYRDGPHYSVHDVALALYGVQALKPELVAHVAAVARDAGYPVIASRAETLSKEQAEWVAAQARAAAPPAGQVLVSLNGNGKTGH